MLLNKTYSSRYRKLISKLILFSFSIILIMFHNFYSAIYRSMYIRTQRFITYAILNMRKYIHTRIRTYIRAKVPYYIHLIKILNIALMLTTQRYVERILWGKPDFIVLLIFITRKLRDIVKLIFGILEFINARKLPCFVQD